MSQPSDRETTAHHEAGHVVVAVRNGMTVLDASIEHDEQSNGRINRQWVENPCPWANQEVHLANVAVCLAGPLAAVILRDGTNSFVATPFQMLKLALDGWQDCDHAVRFAKQAYRSKLDCPRQITDRQLLECAVKTHSLLVAHWPTVQAIAAALLERETLTGHQLRAVIANSQFLCDQLGPLAGVL